ncbi:hypothetical protein RFW85_03420 [Acinetobacter sp. 12966]|uniref:RipA family octameric membrane protein n=1 Tax=Acinetobacter sp. 12966 TaxID=3058488 RepID=UPI002813DE0B|nr:hypothetical protein [Acinetobacter sp. 12966]MDQ9948389.1 hypothetical protein [Acinetobacter sp. 12966]
MNRLEINKTLLDHAWKYFEIHSDQRIKLFNFYLVIIAASGSALAYILQNKSQNLLGIFLGLFLVFVSFIFWKLDQRTAFLVKQAEKILSNLEKEYDPKYYIFSNEALDFTKENTKLNFFSKKYSYRNLFNAAFLFVSILGGFFSIISIMSFFEIYFLCY